MMPKTREAYLRKRLIRLLTQQQRDLQYGRGLPEGVTIDRTRRTEVRANIDRVIKAITFEDKPTRMVTETFVTQALRNSYTHIHSQRATIEIIMPIVNELLSDEIGNAYREHTVDQFRISWVTRDTLKQRKRMRHKRMA